MRAAQRGSEGGVVTSLDVVALKTYLNSVEGLTGALCFLTFLCGVAFLVFVDFFTTFFSIFGLSSPSVGALPCAKETVEQANNSATAKINFFTSHSF